MRITLISFCLTVLAALAISMAGCGASSAEKSAGKPPAADTGHDDHDGHDHGAEASDEHPTEGPHGGHLVELGNEEYHAELLHDEKTHTVTVHLLDAAGKEPVAIAETQVTLQLSQDGQFVKYDLKSVPGSGAAAAQFAIVDVALCDALSHGDQTRGRLQVTINGQPYTGSLEHSSHGDHDHEGHDHAGE